MCRSEKFYFKRLYDYLTDYYWVHEEDIEWCPNPAVNQWKFKVPGNKAFSLLTCDDDGNVTEEMVLW